MQRADLDTILGKGQWFASMPERLRAVLLRHGRLRTMPDGSSVYKLGDPPDGIYAVAEGEVRLIAYPAQGKETLYLVAQPGSWIGEVSVLDGGPRFHDAICVGPSTILHLTMRDVETVASAEPNLYRHLGILACWHHRAALSYIGQALTRPASARLAQVLLQLGASHGRPTADGIEIASKVTQDDLASMIGVSRQSLSKLLKRLEAERIVRIGYAQLTLLDSGRLKADARRS